MAIQPNFVIINYLTMKTFAYSPKLIVLYSLILFFILIITNPLSYLQTKETKISFETAGSNESYVVNWSSNQNNSSAALTSTSTTQELED